MKILGINIGHNSTIAVLEDGKIVFCQSEERFNRIKNSYGLPFETIAYIKKHYYPPDYIVINFRWPYFFESLKKNNYKSFRFTDDFNITRPLSFKNIIKFLWWRHYPNLFKLLFRLKNRAYIGYLNKVLEKEKINKLCDFFGLSKEKFIFLDHHTAHVLSGCFNLDQNKETLIFTADESGDGICASVSVYKNGNLSLLSKTNDENSLGMLWHTLTGFMGLKPLEDEYKIMGLAPYAKHDKAINVADKFSRILKINEKGEFEAQFPTNWAHFYFYNNLMYERFDNLAGGIQLFTENIVSEWIKYWINKTGIKKIALSGGLFMNVKLNQKISQMSEVEEIFIMPSAGDESSTFGCCFYGYKKYCDENKLEFNPQPFTHLYLGVTYDNSYIDNFIKKLNLKNKYKVEYYENIEKKIANLLAKNKIVARFSGPMEFGARALGNRSILANPSDYDNVRIINEMIKQRDFWMPFACSILEEFQDEYIINPKKIKAPYMIITFDTTEKGRKCLKAGMHPYDFTVRPQIVTKEFNHQYHYLISEFSNLTGIGAVLNTSFNLHGEPLVCSPEDALSTFERSGLEYLALENYLISKN